MTSQQQIFPLINIPWAITCERGIGAQQGTPAESRGGSRRGSDTSSGGDQSVWADNLEGILSEGQWRRNNELATMAQRWWHRDRERALAGKERNSKIPSRHFSNPCPGSLHCTCPHNACEHVSAFLNIYLAKLWENNMTAVMSIASDSAREIV